MDIFNASYADSLFSATLTQASGLEGLANAALQRGSDRFMKKDYESAVKEFKRATGIGRGSSFAADAAQYLAMSYVQLEDTENGKDNTETKNGVGNLVLGSFNFFGITLGSNKMVGGENEVPGKIDDTDKHEDAKDGLKNTFGVSLRIGSLVNLLVWIENGISDHNWLIFN